MSSRDLASKLLDSVPDYKMGYVLAYIQGIVADEEADDRFCEALLQDYLADTDPDKHKDAISIKDLAQEAGIEL